METQWQPEARRTASMIPGDDIFGRKNIFSECFKVKYYFILGKWEVIAYEDPIIVEQILSCCNIFGTDIIDSIKSTKLFTRKNADFADIWGLDKS